MSEVQALLDRLADLLAVRVADRLASTARGMVSQHGSPLGARRHRAAVRRRMERGEPGAAVVGRRHLLSHDALGEELSRASAEKVRAAGGRNEGGGELGELEREIVGGLKYLREVK